MIRTAMDHDRAIIVRQIGPSSERAWRFGRDGSIAICTGHKGPWVVCSQAEVPLAVTDAACRKGWQQR